METDLDRNPSPPPELLEGDGDLVPDKLGDSVFSKHWIFQTLISIIETVNKGNGDVSSPPLMQGSSSDMPQESGTDIVELNPELEEDACTLWDMSGNHDVACFLQEFRVAEIFLEVIEKTQSPRLLEIVIGILGNIVSFDELCKDVSKNVALVNAVVRLSGSSDAPTVIQVLRMIHTGIVNTNTAEIWIEVIRTDNSFMENSRFILENSLNGEVLKRTLQLLYYILDKDDQWCLEWGKENQVGAIVDAGKQLNSVKNFEALDEFWMVMNLLCLHEDNIRVLNAHFPYVYQIFYNYLSTIEDYEDILPPVHRITTVAAAISATSTFLKFESENYELIAKDNSFISFLFKMLKSVCEAVQVEELKSRSTLSEEVPSEICSSSSMVPPEDSMKARVGSAGSISDRHFAISGGSWSIGRKIPVYKSCITKTAADRDNLVLLRECLEELCVIIRSHVDTVKS